MTGYLCQVLVLGGKPRGLKMEYNLYIHFQSSFLEFFS